MAPAVLVLDSGYFVGGALGDFAIKRSPRGRVLVSLVGVIMGAVFLTITMNVPIDNQVFFIIMLMFTALFIPFASPNLISTVYDITLAEVRSTALDIQYFIENAGAALAPPARGPHCEQINASQCYPNHMCVRLGFGRHLLRDHFISSPN